MTIIERTALHLTRQIRKNYEGAASEAILHYALVIVLNAMAVLFLVISVSSITGNLGSAWLSILTFMMLKYITGGIHLRSSMACTLVSSGVLLAIIHAPITFHYTGMALNLLAAILMFIYAPGAQIRKGTIDHKYYPRLKWAAVLLCVLNFLLQSPLLSLIFTIQSLSITPYAGKLIDYVEGRLPR
jgi:accessory gene regulator B